MNVRAPLSACVLGLLVVAGCRCEDDVQKIDPSLAVGSTQVSYGKVKVGETAETSIRLSAQVNASVNIFSVELHDVGEGGASAFALIEPPTVVPALEAVEFKVRFAPAALRAYTAELVISSDDPDRPTQTVSIFGEGAEPILAVTPACSPTRQCRGTATLEPRAIDFGEEPLSRAVALPSTELPTVTLVNEGEVEAVVTRIAIVGPDATAFNFEGNAQLPHTLPDGSPALFLGAGEGANLSIRFKPTSEQQLSYQAEVVVESDDPVNPKVTVALRGTLGANLPPKVCANLTQVTPPGEATVRYDTQAQWAPLLVPPSGGYDFTATRDIRPRSEILFSALSNSADDRTCTTDPEDRRFGLTYQWAVTRSPGPHPVTIVPTTPGAAKLSPSNTLDLGEYEVTLTVKDAQGAAGAPGHTTVTTLRFKVELKEDLVAQLSWGDFPNVDLDLHLVRPSATDPQDPWSGFFNYFEAGQGRTSGDMNGYARSIYAANRSLGFNFNWGGTGEVDDPRLNLDDNGKVNQFEQISLNYPENDRACAQADCVYRVFVHYFHDDRKLLGATCSLTGCKDGEPCDCAGAGERCVADSAPIGAAPSGTGRCATGPRPEVRIFLKSNPIPAAVIPLEGLMPEDELAIGAPCHALYVADVVWPRRGSGLDGGTDGDGGTAVGPYVVVRGADSTGRITSPELARFGWRQGAEACTPNIPQSSTQKPWYGPEPL